MKEIKRIMGLDVGEARVGLALSDPLLISAQTHGTLERKKDFFPKLREIILEKNVQTLVVGLPLELDGAFGPQAKKVQDFVEKLLKNLSSLDLKIEYQDERMSTLAAEQVIASSKLKNKQRSAALDTVSAAIILESYLARHRVQEA